MDNQEFTLTWFGTDLGPYALPVYVDRSSEFRRALLTPLAATGDVIVVVLVVGAVAGAIVVYSFMPPAKPVTTRRGPLKK